MQAGAKIALSVPWQDIKAELAEAVDQVKYGYWARHRRNTPATAVNDSQPAALEVRLFCPCLLRSSTACLLRS